jgi:hypothetical protein
MTSPPSPTQRHCRKRGTLHDRSRHPLAGAQPPHMKVGRSEEPMSVVPSWRVRSSAGDMAERK